MSRISVTQVIQIVVFGICCMIEFVFDWIKLLLSLLLSHQDYYYQNCQNLLGCLNKQYDEANGDE